MGASNTWSCWNCSMHHLIHPIFILFGKGWGGGLLDFCCSQMCAHQILIVFSLSSQYFPQVLNVFPISPHFVLHALPPNICPLGACKKVGKYCDLCVSMFGVNRYFYYQCWAIFTFVFGEPVGSNSYIGLWELVHFFFFKKKIRLVKIA
jgi:hypothetical protein